MTGIALQLGLPEALRADAARLYWQAFGTKLGVVLGPEPRALRFLARVMKADQVITALGPDGGLLGIAGFKTPHGGFAAGQGSDLRAIYGPFGGWWRRVLLGRLSDEVDTERFLVDGLCVDAPAQGQGLGTALLDAICAEARLRHYPAVRLDVIERNARAIALYRRLGFEVVARQDIGLLRLVFRFSATLTMVRAV